MYEDNGGGNTHRRGYGSTAIASAKPCRILEVIGAGEKVGSGL